MKIYTVKRGDTLGSIALKYLGASVKWREIATLNALKNPNKIEVGQLLQLPIVPKTRTHIRKSDVVFSTTGRKVYYQTQNDSSQHYLGLNYKRGIFRRGTQKPERFIQQHPSILDKLHISKSEANALCAASENEGNLDAINTWDNAYLSFGMFQWTLGTGSSKGELPAFIKLVRESSYTIFYKFFGQFGIWVTADTNSIDGYLIYKHKKLMYPYEKQLFRTHELAYRFIAAGLDKQIAAMQILHAINRFNRFYFTPTAQFDGTSLFDLLSSEYAAALFLDNHVNRPGYLFPCVAKAVRATGLSFDHVKNGGTTEELKVIRHYLKIRETYGKYPMTDAKKRAVTIKRYVTTEKLSAAKGSFVSNRALR